MGQGKGGGECRIKCTNIQFWVPLVIRKFRVYLEIGFICCCSIWGVEERRGTLGVGERRKRDFWGRGEREGQNNNSN